MGVKWFERTLPNSKIAPENRQKGPKRTFHQLQPLEFSEVVFLLLVLCGGVLYSPKVSGTYHGGTTNLIFGYFGGGVSLT